ncbi:MAG: 23S rRNA (guanine(745)-N(1))-methyltransferase [Methylovulum sp.]|nr:23S rRNA (guanine(745)-N(1))-methyltransferase [Methylovulum sp.]
MPLSPYLCPICAAPLTPQSSGTSYHCPMRHNFDLAREGYLNLLPVQHKHSSEPGDNKSMLYARRAFLEAGYYEPMAKAVAMMVAVGRPQGQAMRLLDVGCGEGYYDRQIHAYCGQSVQIELHGADIAKAAVAAAAKKLPSARYIVASSKRLPYADQYFDTLLRVFAPSDEGELKRLLQPSGRLLIVTPGPRHLAQLKAFIYSEVREHAEEIVLPQGFERLDTQRISYRIKPDRAARAALLQMTPFAWRTNPAIRQALDEPEELDIETDFILTLAIKTAKDHTLEQKTAC